MNRKQMLLLILSEECNEVAQRISKAIRFTCEEVQPDQPDKGDNADRIVGELNDLFAVIDMLKADGVLPHMLVDNHAIVAKKEKVEKYLLYSKSLGVLKDE